MDRPSEMDRPSGRFRPDGVCPEGLPQPYYFVSSDFKSMSVILPDVGKGILQPSRSIMPTELTSFQLRSTWKKNLYLSSHFAET